VCWRRALNDERGGVAIMAAAGGGLFCLLAALTVDLSALALEGRTLQGAADLAALSAARDLPRAQAAARATAEANLSDVSAETATGLYIADAAVPPPQRFTQSQPLEPMPRA
jgi:uncharacterized membrane protein